MKENKEKFKSLFEYYSFTKMDEKKYPVISGILKKANPQRIEKEIKEVQKVKLPSEIQKWIKEYESFGQRSSLFWQFMFRGSQMFSFIKQTKKYKISELKILITMFIILFDDVADGTKNKKLLNEMIKVISNNKNIDYKKFSTKEKNYLKFTLKLWKHISRKVKKLPSFLQLKDFFEYDIQQTLNAIKYSCLVNKSPYFINKKEFWLYTPHTLQGMINCSLDLMCFDEINLKEIGKIREIFWNAQKMGRISNCLSTWKDELIKKDFTSTVLVYAIDNELIDFKDLYAKNGKDIIKKIKESNIENNLFGEWENSYNEINFLCNKIKIIKSNALLNRLEIFILLYLSLSKFYDHRYNT